ncbi:MAG TPA: hypothetical protein VF795_12190, partial [Desulfuromonadaceae bacterium]
MPVSTIAFHNIYDELNRENRLFEERDATIGDDLLLPFNELRRRAAENGIKVATTAVLPPEGIDAYVFIDMPDPGCRQFREALAANRPLYLVVMESRLVRPENFDAANHRYFRKIFTYDDSLVDGKRFIKLNYAFRFPATIPHDLGRKEKLCVTIAGNKRSADPHELYSERLALIRWFERNRPGEFDLYGTGWDEGSIGIHFPRPLTKRWGWLKRLGGPAFPSW